MKDTLDHVHIIDKLCKLFKNGIQNNEERELLGQSLFYYCCGKDPTPIIAFGSDYPLYIYSDIVNYGDGDFEYETKVLYDRLNKAGFKLVDVCKLKKSGCLRNAKNAVLTLWTSPQNKAFSLLYVQNNAVKTFCDIYSDGSNYIQPKCICNYRNEGNFIFLNDIEKRTEFVLGYCYNKKYRRVAEYNYYGDYEKQSKVSLFHRMFWYVY